MPCRFFLRDVIIGAGAVDLVAESSVRAHSIRGVATSAAFFAKLVGLLSVGGRKLEVQLSLRFLLS